jgi:hypothetical protein
LELVNWMWRLVFRFVTAAIVLHHHNGDVVSPAFSPIYAFFFTRLRIGGLCDDTPASEPVPG